MLHNWYSNKRYSLWLKKRLFGMHIITAWVTTPTKQIYLKVLLVSLWFCIKISRDIGRNAFLQFSFAFSQPRASNWNKHSNMILIAQINSQILGVIMCKWQTVDSYLMVSVCPSSASLSLSIYLLISLFLSLYLSSLTSQSHEEWTQVSVYYFSLSML